MFVYPVPLLFFATSNYPNSILSFLRFNLCGLAGFALATALLCLYSIALGAPPVFFWSEFITATHSFDPSFYPRPTDNWAWFQHDTNLPLFLIAATASVLAMARIAIWRRQPMAVGYTDDRLSPRCRPLLWLGIHWSRHITR
jgi:hypothetical protein